MKVTRVSIASGKTREMEIPITLDQLMLWKSGTVIQDAMPHLTADEREFLMTGITPDEWETLKDDSEDTP